VVANREAATCFEQALDALPLGPARFQGICKYLQARLQGASERVLGSRSIRRAPIRATCHSLTLMRRDRAPRPKARLDVGLGRARAPLPRFLMRFLPLSRPRTQGLPRRRSRTGIRVPAGPDDGTRPGLFAPLVRVALDQPERRLHHDPDRGAEGCEAE
jgi:hypothetical protein